MTSTHFRSCFIIDVEVSKEHIILSDSIHNRYIIDAKNDEVMNQFKTWFKEVFSKAVSQTLTVFQYEVVDVSECETEMQIVKFLNRSEG